MEIPSSLTDRYHLNAHLARGGMADVYEGTDTLLGRRVAIKILHSQYSSDEAFVKRFRREAQAAANLSQTNIVGIFDWGQGDGTYFIVMELVDGRSLRDVLRSEGALLPRRAVEIASEVAAALSVAHQAGLVHRDVKPGNILLAKDGTVKVTDFGIARAWDDSQELTKTGSVIGTATYFSPEQAQGATADARSDVYALGVVLYEMLTGRPPYQGDSMMSVAFQHVSAEAPSPASLNPDVPPELAAVVMKAMRKDPAARYQTAAEMRSDLVSVLAGQPVAAGVVASAAAPGGEPATQLMTTTPVPPPTVPPDEVYRQVEDDPPSQIPFVLTAAGLLVGLVLMIFFLFRLAGGAETDMRLVPDVEGFTEAAALLRLQAEGFEWEVVREPHPDVEAGIVIRTDPAGGTEAEEGSLVTVFVSEGSEVFPVPLLIGRTIDDARRILSDGGWAEPTVTERPSADFEEGVVMEQDPISGVERGLETQISLVVSTGPERFDLPDLEGLTQLEAAAELSALGLRWNSETEFSSTIPAGRVIRTVPAAGTEVESGDTIQLVVSDGPAPVDVPNLVGMTPAQAQAALEAVGLVYNQAAGTLIVVDPNQHGRVVSQTPSAGTSVNVGTVVTVTLGEFVPPTTTAPPPTTTTPQPDPPGGGDD